MNLINFAALTELLNKSFEKVNISVEDLETLDYPELARDLTMDPPEGESPFNTLNRWLHHTETFYTVIRYLQPKFKGKVELRYYLTLLAVEVGVLVCVAKELVYADNLLDKPNRKNDSLAEEADLVTLKGENLRAALLELRHTIWIILINLDFDVNLIA